MKKLLALLLAFALLLYAFPFAYADEEAPEPEPDLSEYTNAESASVTLTKVSSSSAKIKLNCRGKDGTTSITANAYLEHWTGSSWERALINGNSSVNATGTNVINTSFTTSVSGGTYRATASYTVVRNGSSEVVTVRSSSVAF